MIDAEHLIDTLSLFSPKIQTTDISKNRDLLCSKRKDPFEVVDCHIQDTMPTAVFAINFAHMDFFFG